MHVSQATPVFTLHTFHQKPMGDRRGLKWGLKGAGQGRADPWILE